MRKRLIAGAFVVVAVAGLWAAARVGARTGQPAKAGGGPLRATIVAEGVLGRGGVGEVRAVRVADPAKLSALEAFFPGYRRRPTSDTAGGWMAGHQVYFDFAGGETVCVTVSKNEDAGSWSAGRGDFETNGDFNAFVAGLPGKD